jgi:hypothetical protein
VSSSLDDNLLHLKLPAVFHSHCSDAPCSPRIPQMPSRGCKWLFIHCIFGLGPLLGRWEHEGFVSELDLGWPLLNDLLVRRLLGLCTVVLVLGIDRLVHVGHHWKLLVTWVAEI